MGGKIRIRFDGTRTFARIFCLILPFYLLRRIYFRAASSTAGNPPRWIRSGGLSDGDKVPQSGGIVAAMVRQDGVAECTAESPTVPRTH